MEMCYDGALVMPSSYAVMDEDEMMHVEGGYWFDRSRNTVANLTDIAIVLATAGMAVTISIKRLIIMKGANVVKATMRTSVTRIGLSIGIASQVANAIMTVANFSIGYGIAYLLDKFDETGLNGRVQF